MLRHYQQDAVDDLRACYRRGSRAPLLTLPTGGGKTFIFCYVAKGAAGKGSRVLVLVHRQELLKQTSRSLESLQVEHGLIAAHSRFDRSQQVQVASVQTLVRRFGRRGDWSPDLIIVDEAHHAVAGSWAAILARWPQARVLGVTATPCRLDGRGLRGAFDDLVIGPSVADLMDQGHLSPCRVYAPPVVADLQGVRTRMGDFAQDQAAAAMDKPTITGDAVDHYRRICPGAPAIAFCASVAHAEHVADQFKAAGFEARSLDGGMADLDRADAIAALGDGRLQVLTSCDIVSEGTDIPVVTAAILLRPTQSEGLFLQQVGRVLRPAPGKDYAVVLDHVGNVARHGLPDDDREWSLDAPKRSKRKKKDDDEEAPKVRQCPACFAAHRPAPKCPICGHVYAKQEREIQQVAGELKQVDPDDWRRKQRREVGSAKTLEDLEAIGERRGYKPGWARHVWESRQRRAQGVYA